MGLLDLFNDDNARFGVGLLAAAGPRPGYVGTGDRLNEALGTADAFKQNQLRQKMGDLQYQTMIQSLEAATRKNKLINEAIAQMNAPLEPDVNASAAAMGAGAQQQPNAIGPDGQPMNMGGVGPTNANAQRLPAPVAGGMFGGLPRNLVVNDLSFNEGKGLSGFMNQRTSPTDFQKETAALPPDQQADAQAHRFNPLIINRGFGVGRMVNGQYVPDQASLEQALALERGKQQITAPMESPVTLKLSGGQELQLSRPEYATYQQTGQLPARYGQGQTIPSPRPSTLPAPQPGMTGNFTGPAEEVLKAISAIKDPQERSNALDAYASQVTGQPRQTGLGVPGLSQSQPDQINQNRQNAAGKAVDEQFAKDYVAFATGGASDAAKQLGQLKDVVEQLKKPKANLTGPIIGSVPDSVKKFTTPDAIAMRERVEEVVQRSLRAILGAQFTEKEGERLIARAYNPNLSEQENAIRVGRLYSQLEQAFRSKQSAASYFQKNNTLEGWSGKIPSIGDFNVDSAKQAGGSAGGWSIQKSD